MENVEANFDAKLALALIGQARKAEEEARQSDLGYRQILSRLLLIVHDAQDFRPMKAARRNSISDRRLAAVEDGSAALRTCKRKEEQQQQGIHTPGPKKPRLVFTDIQRRTLQAIFKETKRPSKEMQVTIAQQLGLDVSTVANFFMNARRRGADRHDPTWTDYYALLSSIIPSPADKLPLTSFSAKLS
ncbi:Homeobox protein onecut [Trichinella murrelli]|uniref:Homeobox protein onecut n=1 Tax=Trichinella murrelli TaxID=144512 RepID=A0A0V0U5F4_9BILA|nr:Homeobox protein onecut [Trichinella murrelli]